MVEKMTHDWWTSFSVFYDMVADITGQRDVQRLQKCVDDQLEIQAQCRHSKQLGD